MGWHGCQSPGKVLRAWFERELPSKSDSSILCYVRRVLEGSAQILRTASLESPLISVVLPTLNRAALLPESIESVLKQTERNLELIVVDDGSSDSTGEIIERYAQQDRRITWIRQQNLGLPKGLNNGFRLARGEFFTWTSDDNRYFPDACSIMSRALLADPEVGFVFADMVRRRPSARRPGSRFRKIAEQAQGGRPSAALGTEQHGGERGGRLPADRLAPRRFAPRTDGLVPLAI